MADYTLTNPTVTAALRPKRDTDNYATHTDDFGEGGYRSVASLANLDTIPLEKRKAYMMVIVRNYAGSPRPFWLASPDNSAANLANNAFWQPVPFTSWVTIGPSGGYIFKGKFDASDGSVSTGDYAGQTLNNTPTPAAIQAGWYWQADTAGTYDFGSTASIVAEVVGSGDASNKQFSGVLANSPVNVSSISFTDDTGTPQVVTDDGSGNLIGDVDGTGTNTIDYKTGEYDFTFAAAPPTGTDNVTVDYDWGEHIFALGDRAIWNGSTFDIDEQQNASNDWALITGMPSIISDIGDGTFVPVSQTDFDALEVEVDANTAALALISIGAGTDITAISDGDLITKQMILANFFTETEVTNIQTALQANIDAIINDSPSSIDQIVGSFTSYVGRIVDTYSSSKIEDRLLDVYNAAIADAPGGNVYATIGTATGTFDGSTLAIDFGVKSDKVLVALVGNVPQTETTGYTINNSGATTILTFSGTASDYNGVKYEIKYIQGIGDANETDPIFTASVAYNITSTNVSNWNQAYNKYVVSGALNGADELILTLRDGTTLAGIDLSSLSGGGGFVLSPLTPNYLSKSNAGGDNLSNSQIFDNGTSIGIFTNAVTDASLTVRKDINSNPLTLLENTNSTGNVLRLEVPTSGTGKFLQGYRGTTETVSITSLGYGTFEKLYLKGSSTITANPVFLTYNILDDEITRFNSPVDLNFILGNGATATGRIGYTQGWRLTDLAGSGSILAGADNLGNFIPITLGTNLSFAGGVLNAAGSGGTSYTFSDGITENSGAVKLGGTFDEAINIDSTNSSQFSFSSGNGSTLNNYFTITSTAVSMGVSSGTQSSYAVFDVPDNALKLVNYSDTEDSRIYLQDGNILFTDDGTSKLNGAVYIRDTSSNWGTINTSNLYVPHVGWIENRYFKNTGGTISGGVTLSDLAGSDKLMYITTAGLLQTVTLGANLTLSGSTLSAAGSGVSTLAALTDTTITGPSNNHYLGYDGSAWVNRQIAYSEISGTPTIPSLSITDTVIPKGNGSGIVDSPMSIDASGRLTLQATSPTGSGRLESHMSSATEYSIVAEQANTGGAVARFNLPTGATTTAEYIEFYKGTTRNAYIRSDGKGYFASHNISSLAGSGTRPLKVDNVGDVSAGLINYNTEIINLPTIPTTIGSLTDVVLTSVANNDILMYVSAASRWENKSITRLTDQYAYAGDDYTISLADTSYALLDGSESYGRPTTGSPVLYAWSKTSGPLGPTFVNGTNCKVCLITGLSVGTYIFQLSVNDGTGVQTDSVTITVTA